MRKLIFVFVVIGSTTALAQDISVEYDKERDLSKYKTFSLGESEIITPKDQRTVSDDKLHEWVDAAIVAELTEKGLTQIDTLGDLIATYIIGSTERMDVQNLGPLGTSPSSSSQTWSRDFRQGSFVIDLNDRSNFLIWRVNVITSNGTPGTASVIEEIVAKGFKKLSIKPKKEKKKHS